MFAIPNQSCRLEFPLQSINDLVELHNLLLQMGMDITSSCMYHNCKAGQSYYRKE